VASLNGTFKGELVTYLGYDGNFNDLLVAYLQDKTSSTATNVVDLWKSFMLSVSYGDAQFNDNVVAYLNSEGYVGHFNDMMAEASTANLFSAAGGGAFCSGTELFCNTGGDTAGWMVGPTGGSISSDGTEWTATVVSSYTGYIEVTTVPGMIYDVELELTSTVASYFYAETYDTSWSPELYIETMNNETGLTGVVSGKFLAFTTTTRILFGDGDSSSFTFKNLKVTAEANWRLGSAVQTANSLDVSSEDINPRCIFIKSDGTTLFFIGGASDSVYEYSLSTAWDLSTATYTGNSLNVTSQEGNPMGLQFSPDGTHMYTIGASGDAIDQYDLSTGWDLSTASYVGTFSTGTQDTSPTALWFKSDGTVVVVSGRTNDRLYQYDLSTAWDITTASYIGVLDVSGDTGQPKGVFVRDDGFLVYLVDGTGSVVYSYYMEQPWQLSSAVSIGTTLTLDAAYTDYWGILAKPDGTKLFVGSQTGATIISYTINS